jgi:hypothetical protein
MFISGMVSKLLLTMWFAFRRVHGNDGCVCVFITSQFDKKWRTSVLVSGLITFIAAVHYFYMKIIGHLGITYFSAMLTGFCMINVC